LRFEGFQKKQLKMPNISKNPKAALYHTMHCDKLINRSEH